mgnify:CR=1 FL=1
MDPNAAAEVVSSRRYAGRFVAWVVGPLVAGINSTTGEPSVCSFDSIGSMDVSHDFVVTGTATNQLYGMAESLYEKDMSPEQLFETISQTLLCAADRDAITGSGGLVYVIEKNGKDTKKLLKSRQD